MNGAGQGAAGGGNKRPAGHHAADIVAVNQPAGDEGEQAVAQGKGGGDSRDFGPAPAKLMGERGHEDAHRGDNRTVGENLGAQKAAQNYPSPPIRHQPALVKLKVPAEGSGPGQHFEVVSVGIVKGEAASPAPTVDLVA